MGDIRAHAAMLMAYNAWANARVLDHAAALTDADLDEAATASYGSVRATLEHMLYAQDIWYTRVAGEPVARLETPSFAALRTAMERSDAAWISFVESMRAEDWDRIIDYRDTKGVDQRRRLGHVIAHVVNHGTLHRGEAGMLLAQRGHSPGDLDMAFFVAEWSPL